MTMNNVRDIFEYDSGAWYRRAYITRHKRKIPKKPVDFYSSNREDGYVMKKTGKYRLYVHRIVWEYFNGPIPENMEIDHINGIRHDNRIENLRLVTCRGNNQNNKKHRKGKLVGCSYNKDAKKWQVQITVNKKRIFLGYYLTPQEGHKVYKRYLEENSLI